MDQSAQQRVAEQDLLEAIERFVRFRIEDEDDEALTRSDPSGVIVTGFVLTASVSSFELNAAGATQYVHANGDGAGGKAPAHVCIGLAQLGYDHWSED